MKFFTQVSVAILFLYFYFKRSMVLRNPFRVILYDLALLARIETTCISESTQLVQLVTQVGIFKNASVLRKRCLKLSV